MLLSRVLLLMTKAMCHANGVGVRGGAKLGRCQPAKGPSQILWGSSIVWLALPQPFSSSLIIDAINSYLSCAVRRTGSNVRKCFVGATFHEADCHYLVRRHRNQMRVDKVS